MMSGAKSTAIYSINTRSDHETIPKNKALRDIVMARCVAATMLQGCKVKGTAAGEPRQNRKEN